MTWYAPSAKAKVMVPALIWVEIHAMNAAPSSIPASVGLKVGMSVGRIWGGCGPAASAVKMHKYNTLATSQDHGIFQQSCMIKGMKILQKGQIGKATGQWSSWIARKSGFGHSKGMRRKLMIRQQDYDIILMGRAGSGRQIGRSGM